MLRLAAFRSSAVQRSIWRLHLQQEKALAPLVLRSFATSRSSDDQPKKGRLAWMQEKTSMLWSKMMVYWEGTKQLYRNHLKVKELLERQKMNGLPLTYTEKMLIRQTKIDKKQFLPVTIILIAPGGGITTLVPLLAFFPSLLPSTFETSSEKEMRLRKQAFVQCDAAFRALVWALRKTEIEEAYIPYRSVVTQLTQCKTTLEAVQVLEGVDEKFGELTIEDLPRPILKAICHTLFLSPSFPSFMLRRNINKALASITEWDEDLRKMGVSMLSTAEMRDACLARGMRGLDSSRTQLRKRLEEWCTILAARTDDPKTDNLLLQLVLVNSLLMGKNHSTALFLTLLGESARRDVKEFEPNWRASFISSRKLLGPSSPT